MSKKARMIREYLVLVLLVGMLYGMMWIQDSCKENLKERWAHCTLVLRLEQSGWNDDKLWDYFMIK